MRISTRRNRAQAQNRHPHRAQTIYICYPCYKTAATFVILVRTTAPHQAFDNQDTGMIPYNAKSALTPFLLFTVISAYAHALSVEESVQLALQHNAELRQQALLLENARKENSARWNAFLPSISAGGGISNTHTFTPQTAAQWAWNASAGISINLQTNAPVQLMQKTLAFEAAQTQYNQLERSVVKEVILAYYALIALRTNIEILQTNLTLSEEVYRQNRINYEYGLTSELDMLRSQYAYQRAGPELQAAESSYESSLRAFLILIGADEGEPDPNAVPPLYALDLPDVQLLTDSYSANRLDIIQLEQAVHEAELNKLSLALSTRAPTLNLSETLRLSPDGSDAFSAEPGVDGTFSVSLSIPLDSLIPGSSDSLSIAAAENAITAAQIALETGQKQASQNIADCAAETKRLYETLNISRLNHQITERAYALAQDGYDNGLVSQTDLETSRQDMTAAWQAVVQAEINYFSAVYNLADALQLSVSDVYSLWGIQ